MTTWLQYGGDDVEVRSTGLGGSPLLVPLASINLYLDAGATTPVTSPADVRVVGGGTLTLPLAVTVAGSQVPAFEARSDATLYYRVNGGPVAQLPPTAGPLLAAVTPLIAAVGDGSGITQNTDYGVAARRQAGADDDARIDAAIAAAAALTTFGARVALLTEQYVCNKGHVLGAGTDNLTIAFAPGAKITLGPSPTGTLSSAGRLFDLTGRTGVTILNPQIRPPASAYSWPGGECAAFYLANAVGCAVLGGYVDLTGVYTQLDTDTPQYVRPMDAVFVRGTTATDNRIENMEVHGTRITYSYAGASRTKCLNNRSYNSCHNAFSGFGNGAAGIYNTECDVIGNRAYDPARFGIEDWTSTRGTVIERNRIYRSGSSGISAVGRATVVDNNTIVDCVASTSIETDANGSRTTNNRIYWTGSTTHQSGIICNGADTADAEQNAIIAGNRIYGPVKGITLYGNCLGVDVFDNQISDWSSIGIDATATGTVRSPKIHDNRLRQTVPSTQVRYGITLAIANSEVYDNTIIFTSAASGGTSLDYTIRPGTGSSGSIIKGNIIDAASIVSPAVPKMGTAGVTGLTGLIFADNVLLGGAVLDQTGMTTPIVRNYVTSAPTSADVQSFTASGTWTMPAGAVLVNVVVVGGGGGGGSGRRGAAGTVRCGGGAGAGGAITRAVLPASTVTSPVTVTVGAGGTAGASVAADDTSGNAGGAGGTSSFGTYVKAGGGGAGAGGTATTGTGGSVSTGSDPGGVGASASTTGGAGNGNSPGAGGAAGGGAGGGLTTGNVESTGGAGNSPVVATYTAGTAGAVTGGAGGTPATVAAAGSALPGPSAGGGGSAAAAAAGAGGTGGVYGGGGGGGGGSANTFASGAGGVGGAGMVLVITEFS